MNAPQQPQHDTSIGSENQGEGNVDAARNYNRATRDFVESGQVDHAAREADPHSGAEAGDMQRAEREGRARAKEEDPNVARDPRRYGGDSSGGRSADKPGTGADDPASKRRA